MLDRPSPAAPPARAGTSRVLRSLLQGWGVLRSLWIYRVRNRHRHRAMDALYRRFLAPGDLAFDIGSHVGDRIACFRRLDCRVVAVEPQPLLVRVLRRLHGNDRAVVLVDAAIGSTEGRLDLHLNLPNPTVATGSRAFIAAADGAPRWEGQQWTETVDVPVTTLDALVERHGVPAFVKIDVEGLELDVLQGLTRALPALSFEFTTIQRDVAARCIDRLAALGDYGFDLSMGETQKLVFGSWISAEDMKAHIRGLPHAANSGDVYAVRR